MHLSNSSAFVPARVLPTTRSKTLRSCLCMKKRGAPKKKKPNAISRLSKEEKARIDKIAERYGVQPPKPGDQLDRKYTKVKPEEPKTMYQSLAGAVGVETLNLVEQGLYVALGGLLTFLITCGLLISSEAFYKATGKDIPESLDAFTSMVQGYFTPALVIFLVLSSVLGIYKQSQLESGASSYSSLRNGSQEEE
ncbi:hypothetical protein BWQ96_01704 [Gracilariopsis chorda]|uniref:Uncharacterized protein n=1 Tax=Gracilariopsis chorda TaxID=448386 RepID=A0A2V3J2D0_9FLOR|nr:hypothetical protein BWQ96_01704 [Gracilariopsis chorda]|eukprot:PXF48535.1 hypothetical protein BWQ96_01704 [Gracilariopsis chorda]